MADNRKNAGMGFLVNPIYANPNMAPGEWPPGGLPLSRALPLAVWKDKQSSRWTLVNDALGAPDYYTWTWNSAAFDFRPELRDGENEATPGQFTPINHQGSYGLGNSLILLVRTIGLYGAPPQLYAPADFPGLRAAWYDRGDNYDGTLLPRLRNPQTASDYINDGGSSSTTPLLEGASVLTITPCGVRFWQAFVEWRFYPNTPGGGVPVITEPPALQVRATLGV